MELCLEITDDYSARNEMVKRLYDYACRWLDLAIGRAPIEMHTILQVSGILCRNGRIEIHSHLYTSQKYLRESRDTLLLDNVEMGAGVALRYAKAISRLDRQEGRFLHCGPT
jgi:phosphatidylinositol 4-kinase